MRHSDIVDTDVVGYVGPASRPHRVAVRLRDGSRVLSQALMAPVAAEIARRRPRRGAGAQGADVERGGLRDDRPRPCGGGPRGDDQARCGVPCQVLGFTSCERPRAVNQPTL